MPAAASLRESDYLEADTSGIPEDEFVFTANMESVSLVGHALETKCTKPIAFRIARTGHRACDHFGLGHSDHDLPICQFR